MCRMSDLQVTIWPDLGPRKLQKARTERTGDKTQRAGTAGVAIRGVNVCAHVCTCVPVCVC